MSTLAFILLIAFVAFCLACAVGVTLGLAAKIGDDVEEHLLRDHRREVYDQDQDQDRAPRHVEMRARQLVPRTRGCTFDRSVV